MEPAVFAAARCSFFVVRFVSFEPADIFPGNPDRAIDVGALNRCGAAAGRGFFLLRFNLQGEANRCSRFFLRFISFEPAGVFQGNPDRTVGTGSLDPRRAALRTMERQTPEKVRRANERGGVPGRDASARRSVRPPVRGIRDGREFMAARRNWWTPEVTTVLERPRPPGEERAR